MAHASAEDVDLWLDVGLFLDVKITDNEREKVYQREVEKWKAICEAIQAQRDGDNQSDNISMPPTPSYDSIRPWRVAEVIAVQHRSILVKFVEPGLSNQLLNVDECHDRFAELYTKSSQDVSNELACTAGIDCTQLFNELIQHLAFEHIDIDAECRKFCKRFFDNASSVSCSEAPLSKSSRPILQHSPIMLDGSDSELEIAVAQSLAETSSRHTAHVTEHDDEIESQSMSLPLYDPLSHERINVPVRSINCKHASAFDLMTHLTHNNELNSIIWLCPICKQEALADQLVVDMFLYAVLQTIKQSSAHVLNTLSSSASSTFQSTAQIPFDRPRLEVVKLYVNEQLVIDANGQWRLGQERERRKRKFHRIADQSSSSSQPLELSHTSSAYREPPFQFVLTEIYDAEHEVEMIDLTTEDPCDTELVTWLSARIQVKIEKQTAAKQAQIDYEAKVNAEAVERARVAAYSIFYPQQLPSPLVPPFESQRQQSYDVTSMMKQSPVYPAYPYQIQQHQQAYSHSAHSPSVAAHPSHPSHSSASLHGYLPPTSPYTHHFVNQPNSLSAYSPPSREHFAPVSNPPQVRRPPSIDINTATASDLCGCGVSWTLAGRIVEERGRRGPTGYTTMKELCQIKGIGPKTVDKLTAHGVAVLSR